MANTYDSYKDSGIAWIGDIPSGWEIKRLGNFYNPRNEKVSDKDFPPLSVTMKGIVPQLETAAKTDDGDNRKLVKKGDFAINSRSDRRGSCGISDYDGSVSLINTVLCPKGQMNAGFYNWLFHTSMFADEYYKWGHGIVDDLWTTKWSDMKNICVVVPSLEEQSSIANFLDEKCSEIDSLISLQEEMISELQAFKQSVITEAVTKGLDKNVKMKDSGVEWIGEIPEHWDARSVKYIGTSKNGLTYSPSDVTDSNNGTLVLRSSNIQGGKLAFEDNVYVSCDIPKELMLKKGDIVICSRNGSAALVGKCAIVEDNSLVSTYGAFMMRFKSKHNYRYVYYLLTSAISHYKQLFSTTTINQLTAGMFGSLIMPFTSNKEEQHSIATYLDTKTAEIDSLIALKQQKITELKDYKKSIIYEYVTGKKEVSL